MAPGAVGEEGLRQIIHPPHIPLNPLQQALPASLPAPPPSGRVPCRRGRFPLAEEHARLCGVLLTVDGRHAHRVLVREDATALGSGIISATLPALVRFQLELAVALGEREEAERDGGKLGEVLRAGLLVTAQLLRDGKGLYNKQRVESVSCYMY